MLEWSAGSGLVAGDHTEADAALVDRSGVEAVCLFHRTLPRPPLLEYWQHALAEPVELLEVRVAGEDELVDPDGGVLRDAVGHLLVAPDERGAGAAAGQPHAGPQVRGHL